MGVHHGQLAEWGMIVRTGGKPVAMLPRLGQAVLCRGFAGVLRHVMRNWECAVVAKLHVCPSYAAKEALPRFDVFAA